MGEGVLYILTLSCLREGKVWGIVTLSGLYRLPPLHGQTSQGREEKARKGRSLCLDCSHPLSPNRPDLAQKGSGVSLLCQDHILSSSSLSAFPSPRPLPWLALVDDMDGDVVVATIL